MVMPRKPTSQKIQEGTYRKDRANLNEPEHEVSVPDCPPDLSPKAKQEWKKIVPILEQKGIIFEAARASIAAYCTFVARFYQLCRDMNQNEKLIKKLDKTDEEYIQTLLSLEKRSESIDRRMLKAGNEIRYFANEFGITPASVSKVSSANGSGAGSKGSGKKDKSRFFEKKPLVSVK